MDLPDASPAQKTHRALFRLPRPGAVGPDDWQQLTRFCVVGASGVDVNLAVFAALVKGLSVHHLVAATVSFGVAWTSNFLLNRHWTFRRRGLGLLRQGARNLVVSLAALLLNLVILAVLHDRGMAEVTAQLIAIAAVTPVNFLMNRRWSFQ